MDLAPVKHYSRPAYPAQAWLEQHPEMLRAVPARWQGNVLVLTALAASCTLLAGCRSLPSAAAEEDAVTSRVAPLFQRIEERGGLRGKPAMPKFLTEEEARNIIAEEAAASGIKFQPDLTTLPEVPLAQAKTNDSEKPPEKTYPVKLDGSDPDRQIHYEFVSQDDYKAWHENDDGRWAFRPYMQDTADMLRNGLEQVKPEGTYAVFYDPVNYTPETAREELRKQVKDFIEWLKAQDAI